MLADAGWVATIDPPGIDERALDDRWHELGADGLALELARRKAAAVADRHPGALVLAGDQVGVVATASGEVMLTKRGDADGAVDQLMVMSGTTHRLVNGLVLLDTAQGRSVEGLDEQQVTMRPFDRAEATEYVRRFEPFDSSGSYRLEDQEHMAPLAPFVVDVRGEHDSGVRGLPMPLLARLMLQLGIPLPQQ
jgi:septum formation protein